MGRRRFFLSPLLDNGRRPWYTSGMENRTLLIDDLRGVYIPQTWARLWGIEAATAQPELAADILIVREGPDNGENYWESWDRILRDYRRFNQDRGVFEVLEQDGDLWLVAEAE
jgi:hypothetical protein